MTKKTKIKIQLALFVTLLVGWNVVSLALFQKTYQSYSKNSNTLQAQTQAKSALTQIQNNLYIQNKSLAYFAQSQDQKWVPYISNTISETGGNLKTLNQYNNLVLHWPQTDINTQNLSLNVQWETALATLKNDPKNTARAQKVFNLAGLTLNQLTEQTNQLVQQITQQNAPQDLTKTLQSRRETSDWLVAGLNMLRPVYVAPPPVLQQYQNPALQAVLPHSLIIFCVGTGALFLFATLILFQILQLIPQKNPRVSAFATAYTTADVTQNTHKNILEEQRSQFIISTESALQATSAIQQPPETPVLQMEQQQEEPQEEENTEKTFRATPFTTPTIREFVVLEHPETSSAPDLPDIIAALTQDQKEASVKTHIADIQVVPSFQEKDDIILVDFDSQKKDLAEQFREKQKQRRTNRMSL